MIRQADLARELDVSEMAVHRLLKAMHRNGQQLTDVDCIMVIATAELQKLELAGHVAVELVNEFPAELRYVSMGGGRRCWVVFCETGRASFQLAALSGRHLEGILAAHPLSLVLAFTRLSIGQLSVWRR